MIRNGKRGYNNRVDVWAVGCIFSELIVGDRAFAEDLVLLEYMHSSKKISIPQDALERLGRHWESELEFLLNQMLSVDPEKRVPIINVLGQCTFFYEFDSRKRDNAIVSNACRGHGSSFCPLPSGCTISFAPGSSFLLFYISGQESPRVYNVAKGYKPVPLKNWFPFLDDPIMFRRKSNKIHLIASHSKDVIYLQQLESALPLPMIRLQWSKAISAKAFTRDGAWIVCATKDGDIYLSETHYDRLNHAFGPMDLIHYVNATERIAQWDGEITKIGGDPNRSRVFFASGTKRNEIMFTVWQIADSSVPEQEMEAAVQIQVKTTFDGWICAALFNPGWLKNQVLYCPDQFKFAVLDTIQGTEIGMVGCSKEPLAALTYSPGGHYILSSHATPVPKVNIHHANTLHKLHTIEDCGGGPIWFCDEVREICLSGPDHENRIHLINLRAERRQIGF